MESHEPLSPAQALAAVHQGRAASGRRLLALPWWWHTLLTLPLTVMFLAMAVRGDVLRSVLQFGAAVGIGLTWAAYQRRLGMRLNGARRGRTRRLFWGYLATLGVLLLATFYAGQVLAWTPAFYLAAAATLVTGTAYGVLWSRTYAAEMGVAA